MVDSMVYILLCGFCSILNHIDTGLYNFICNNPDKVFFIEVTFLWYGCDDHIFDINQVFTVYSESDMQVFEGIFQFQVFSLDECLRISVFKS